MRAELGVTVGTVCAAQVTQADVPAVPSSPGALPDWVRGARLLGGHLGGGGMGGSSQLFGGEPPCCPLTTPLASEWMERAGLSASSC